MTLARIAAFALALAAAAPALSAQFPAAVIQPESLARLDSAARNDSIRLAQAQLDGRPQGGLLSSVATGEVVRAADDSLSLSTGRPAPYTGTSLPEFALAGVAAMLAGVALIQLRR